MDTEIKRCCDVWAAYVLTLAYMQLAPQEQSFIVMSVVIIVFSTVMQLLAKSRHVPLACEPRSSISPTLKDPENGS